MLIVGELQGGFYDIFRPDLINRTTVLGAVFGRPRMLKYGRVLRTKTRRLPLFSFVRKEVVLMSDYEILIVVLTIIAIVVTLIIEYIKK